ncbi:carbonic anhydrase [Sodiomyces alkalinus F11]|uniref:Carbonic anhydrase n=1 Tax=Sodiomyces alkalinus (strain CBS 110278 / VKM F-3762 / F11) TaxID=1314773 RepID=A0A3N2PMM5_SODAK|nr:carbonic anhydrase [Sodiomyces alkalinus F11]ROT35680.1 carbonic anhydrase [Sodiomyces alkalinus F11]
MYKCILALSALAPLAAANCAHGTSLFPRSQALSVDVAVFGFNGLEGPLNWHALHEDNLDCAVGENQSPINIESATIDKACGSSLHFQLDDHPNGAEFFNLGSTVEAEATGTINLRNKTYNLVQFHFHTPSEHRIDSEYYPEEVHFVFQASDGALAVVGVLIEIGTDEEASSLLIDVFENLEDIAIPGDETHTGPLDFGELEAHIQSSEIFQYSGSLTTPPCTQDIAWNVVKNPIYIDVDTFRRSKSVMKFNSRYTQNTPGQINLLSNACNGI